MLFALVFLAAYQPTLSQITPSSEYKNPHYVSNHSTMVHLFEWKWQDVALECERFLGPKGFGGIQISPPNENLVISESGRPWWERYQPMSYKLVTRSGNETQFQEMTRRCNDAGVRIYADAVINHMTASFAEHIGTAGSTANFSAHSYPGVPYTAVDFHLPYCSIESADYTNNSLRVRNCELSGLKDLNQTRTQVRDRIVTYMNKLIELGVAGFRIDAAKHMWPLDLNAIYSRLDNLSIAHGFAEGARPYIFQEVIDIGGEAVSRNEYTPYATVTEFRFGSELSNAFRGNNPLKWLVNWGPEWNLLAQGDALTFICNHDNQRTSTDILNYKTPRPYNGAVAFALAHPYGEAQFISSFYFNNSDAGPPMDRNQNIISPTIFENGTCGNGWVCEHRWREAYEMVAFRNVAGAAALTNWWDNGGNQIAFGRGDKAFIVFNIESADLNQTLTTGLPAGEYCDVISGSPSGGACTGATVTVNANGAANIFLPANHTNVMLAIHVGVQSRLQ